MLKLLQQRPQLLAQIIRVKHVRFIERGRDRNFFRYTERAGSKVLINGHTSEPELYGREGVSSWKSWKRRVHPAAATDLHSDCAFFLRGNYTVRCATGRGFYSHLICIGWRTSFSSNTPVSHVWDFVPSRDRHWLFARAIGLRSHVKTVV